MKIKSLSLACGVLEDLNTISRREEEGTKQVKEQD